MRHYKFICSFIAILAVLALLAGCTPHPAAPDGKKEGIPVTDCLSREVYVPEKVEHIACLYAFAGHVSVLLGSEGKVCAVVDGLKRDILMQRKIKNIQDLPAPFNSGAVNIEELITTKPDVAFVRLNTAQNPGEAKKLDDAKIPYVVVDYTDMKGQKTAISAMGKALGEEDKANAYLKYYDDTIKMVQERLKDLPENEKVRVFHSVNEATRTDQAGTLSDEVLKAAGLINAAAGTSLKESEGKQYASLEQIYNFDPEAIIVNEPAVTNYIKTNSGWQGLKAVRNDKVYQLPVGISRWAHPGSIETPIAVLYLAKLFYPERFADIDMTRTTQEYYETYFNVQLSDEDISSILSGKGMRIPKPE